MTNKCNHCGKYLAIIDGAKCTKCAMLFHRMCVNIKPGDPIPKKLLCNNCKVGTKRTINASTSSHPSPSSDIENAEENFIDANENNSEKSLAHEIRLLRLEFSSVTRELSRLSTTISEFNKRIDSVEQRLDNLEKNNHERNSGIVDRNTTEVIAQLRSELNDRDQENLLNDIEISGLEEKSGENSTNIVLLVAKKIGASLEERDIVSSERWGPRRIIADHSGQTRPRPIIVRLARRAVRDEMLRAARVRRGCDSSGIVESEAKRFYVNERLTPMNRHIFYKTRELGRRDGWRYIWTRGGRIYARRNGNSETRRIRTLEDTICQMNKSKKLRIGFLNPGSLGTGHDEFLYAMDRHNVDIMALNETWLREGEDARAPRIPGYSLRHVPRPTEMRTRGGGVGFYIKQGISARTLKHPDTIMIEQMWLSVNIRGKILIIGTAYRPPWLSTQTFIDAITDTYGALPYHDYILLVSDFNINLLDAGNASAAIFTDFLTYTNMKQYVTVPTHFTSHSETLLDLICSDTYVERVWVDYICNLSDHAFLSCELNIVKEKPVTKKMYSRRLDDIDLEQLKYYLTTLINWELVISDHDINKTVAAFNDSILWAGLKPLPLI
ncbi:unnamed protein product [Danaus chrysippus]|uniref:(African queen) hypothetical protein n=1 Tax=Danaus chrysippus TaxID=151541 RepID=A0A8J2W6P7_9NEOP|nr:unnamed protein product [Danaus chrysippus]